MEKVLVCGAGGFIGHHLMRYLKEKGYWVRGADIKLPEFSSPDEADEFLQIDLRDMENCLKATEGIDKVYQLAADMGGMQYIANTHADVMRNSGLINLNIAEACKVNKVKRVFFSSSACVYPEERQLTPEVVPLKESDAYPANPDTAYGWEKLFSENLYYAYAQDHGLDVRVARYHNVFGPEGTYEGGKEKAPANMCQQVAAAPDGGSMWIVNDGKQTRSFCYIDECLEASYRLMESDITEPLNIGSDELISMEDMAQMVIGISGKKISIENDMTKAQGVRGRNSDNTLIKEKLGWAPSQKLEDGMKLTYAWINKQINPAG
ncbi:MAG: NAD-dependent dehydratase [Candidatus Harrisonbacteria bacterium CG10_big_fil_rev_8_21_14_0_10_49_15]|uniref:NAD-dependent dehydratase n=1 Tax=Candidatus Harrisonbacteria bacterium CG10_big_fil_rev_8_21_14_0_10_49_15 TaxID=1974587 RepID=A0A2H0ULK6_9BACT|nr:MAG: NAD-dependent dehydratase [Candidatus Harrisonbacteria bacterium CG10_big_fil_rev_8_21_14_0_10_49_15]